MATIREGHFWGGGLIGTVKFGGGEFPHDERSQPMLQARKRLYVKAPLLDQINRRPGRGDTGILFSRKTLFFGLGQKAFHLRLKAGVF